MSNRFTRIILVSGDEQGVREFAISHRMVWLLAILGILLVAAVGYIMVTYGLVARTAARVPALENRIAVQEAQLEQLVVLEGELANMRDLQQRLLLMLGVEVAIDDSAAAMAAAGGLDELAALVQTDPPRGWPASGYVTREFQEGQPARGIRPHPGLDIAGPEGAPILAAADGLASRTGTDPFLGNFVEIQHGMGYVTVYGHCQSVAVARGERVRQGQVIAYMGQTGEASAPHLHFEIWQNGMAVDPRQFLQGEPATP